MAIKANITTNSIEVAAQGRQGVQGIVGAAGPEGPTGPQGPAAIWGSITGTLSDQTDLQAELTELQKPALTVIPVFSTDDLPTAVAGVITLVENDVRYQVYCLVAIGTDKIVSSAARIQIEGMTPDAGFLYTGTGVLFSTDSTVQLFNLNLIGMTATVLFDAANSGVNTILCVSLGLVGGSSTDLVCIDNYDNVLFETCGFVSGNRGICLFNDITNFTVLLCQFQVGMLGINIDYGTALCAATAIETCVSELSSTSTFISAAVDNGNITANGGGTVTHNKINDAAVGSVISVGLSPLDLRWLFIGNNSLVASDRLNPTGWAFYNDGNTVTQTVPSGVGNAVKFSVDGLGANTNSDFAPRVVRGISEMWDTSTDKMIPITLGDSSNVRIAFALTAKGANPSIITIVFDIGGAAGITIPVYSTSITTPNTFPRTVTLVAPVFSLATFLTNGGQIFMYTDSGTLDVENRQILIQRISSGAS
jgi:hypothetical protein